MSVVGAIIRQTTGYEKGAMSVIGLSPDYYVQNTMHLLRDRIPYHLDYLAAQKFGGVPWIQALEEVDRMKGREIRAPYRVTDLQAQLRAVTEPFGAIGYLFDRAVGFKGSSLRNFRNQWAHTEPFAPEDAMLCADLAREFFIELGDEDGEIAAAAIRDAVFAKPSERDAAREEIGIIRTAVERSAEELDKAKDSEPAIEVPEVVTRVQPQNVWQFLAAPILIAGSPAVLDEFPKKAAKAKVRAVIEEIVDAEWPIHIDRVARRTVASFGVGRAYAARIKQMQHQVKAMGYLIDEHRFVWPQDIAPEDFQGFRTGGAELGREFTDIAPQEIANAYAFVRENQAYESEAELDSLVLAIFGRKRKTKSVVSHLARVKKF